MSDTLEVTLDEVRKDNNKSEWTTIPRSRATYLNQDYEVVGYGKVIIKLLEQVYENNPQINPLVVVKREKIDRFSVGDGGLHSGTTVFVPMTLKRWLNIGEDGNKLDNRPEWLKELHQ